MNYTKSLKKVIFIIILLLSICVVLGLISFCHKKEVAHASYDPSTAVDVSSVPVENFSNVKYIANSRYFLLNPSHHTNYVSDGKYGVCSTVAIQMLLGYHNYYTDRRLIPSTTTDEKQFLNHSYGDLNYHPDICFMKDYDWGYLQLGTANDVYNEIKEESFGSDTVVSQILPLTRNGALRFLNKYSPISEAVTLEYNIFSSNTVNSEIEAGRPVVLCLTGNESGSIIFHVVVAYGYATYNGAFGYIVHWGHQGDKTQIWLPENCFAFQVTMNVEHTHKYVENPVDIADSHRMFTCETCGCTTVRCLYQLSEDGSEITGVNYGLADTVNIPSKISGKDILAIGDYALQNCLFSNVTLPYKLRSIGRGAFKNCVNLQTVNIPAQTDNIGDGAFAGCNNLTISISASHTSFSVSDNILFDRNKYKIITSGKTKSTISVPATVKEISPFAFESNTNIQEVRFAKQNPVIGDCAFANCSALQTVYFYDYDRPNVAPNGFSDVSFVAYVPYNSQNVYREALTGIDANIMSLDVVLNYVVDNEVFDSQTAYFGSTLESMPIPTKKGYRFVGWYDSEYFFGDPWQDGRLLEETFNKNLYAKFEPKSYVIIFGGEHSENLENKTVIYGQIVGELPSLTKEGYTFLGWKSSDNTFFEENTVWNEETDLQLTSAWKANEYLIRYFGNGGTPSVESQTVTYGCETELSATCQRSGYDFQGWNTSADGCGESVLSPFTYLTAGETCLYAQWRRIEYSVFYNLNGGVQSEENPATYTVEDEIVFKSPTKKGYTFLCWKIGDKEVNGIEKGNCGDVVAEAYWHANEYAVTLDCGVSPSVSEVIQVFYDEGFFINVTLQKTGYVLDGWFDDNGVKYASEDGACCKTWDKAENATLYALWSVKCYEIQINDNGCITWLGAKGLSNEKCTIEYGTVINGINLIAVFKNSSSGFKTGKIFDHFEFEDKTLDWTSIPDLGKNGSIVTIIPVWVYEVHTVYFNTLCETTVDSVTAEFDSDILLPEVDRSGYVFEGWYDEVEGGTRIVWTKMPDLTYAEQNNGSRTLFARYSLKQYDITYETGGGVMPIKIRLFTISKQFSICLSRLKPVTYSKVGLRTFLSQSVYML